MSSTVASASSPRRSVLILFARGGSAEGNTEQETGLTRGRQEFDAVAEQKKVLEEARELLGQAAELKHQAGFVDSFIMDEAMVAFRRRWRPRRARLSFRIQTAKQALPDTDAHAPASAWSDPGGSSKSSNEPSRER